MAGFDEEYDDNFTAQEIDEDEEISLVDDDEQLTELEDENEIADENDIEEKGEVLEIDEELDLEVEIEAELDGETEVDEMEASVSEIEEDKKKSTQFGKREKQTNPYLTKYEFTKIIGVRAEQLLYGAQQLVKSKETNPLKIAVEELKQRRLPFIVRRKIYQKTNKISYEDWSIEEFKNLDDLISFYDY